MAASSDAQRPAPKSQAAASAAPLAGAPLGKPAPDFTLADLDGNKVSLSSFRGKTVVLEWFNPECPFVKAAHESRSLKGMGKRISEANKDVVWLAINSGAPGKQGAGADVNKSAKSRFGITYPVLLDESGEVGKAYGATRTPHMFVIDKDGVLVYRGAIDSSKGGEPEPGDKVTNYVDAALADLAAGKAVATPETEAFGCSVKYASR